MAATRLRLLISYLSSVEWLRVLELRMASLVPEPGRLDAQLHFVLCDFGSLGRAFVETDPDCASREVVVRDMVTGQFERPLRVLSIDPSHTWSDVCRDIAKAVAAQAGREDVSLTDGTRAFIAEHLGELADA